MRKATKEDLDAIMEIIEATKVILQNEGNNQWDNNYPVRSDFSKDIDEDTLYVSELEEQIIAVVSINFVEQPEYAPLPWARDTKATVIHRMAVSPTHRRIGVGRSLMDFAKSLSIQNGTRYIKTDTNSKNPKMNNLFMRNGFKKVGEIYFRSRADHFNCYEWCEEWESEE